MENLLTTGIKSHVNGEIVPIRRVVTGILFDQADDYQEKASLSVSEQVPHEKSRSSSRKSAAGTVPTVFGSSAGHSFGKPQRDCVSETSLLSQLASAGVGICVHNR